MKAKGIWFCHFARNVTIFWEEKKWDDMIYELGGKANSSYYSYEVAEKP